MQPDHQVSLQGSGVIAKGVPADQKIQFFGLPDYQGQGGEDAEYGEELENEEEYAELYVDEEGTQDAKEMEGNGQEDSNGGGMSTLEKALLASDLAMMGSKVHGLVSGRKNGSAVEGQNTLSMKVKGAANSGKNCGKEFV